MATHHLAQMNIGRLRAPVDSPEVAEFMALLDPVNAIADGSPGFEWRLQSEEGNATAYRVLSDDTLFVNMSVWESLDALRDYVFKTQHRDVLRRRHEWFLPLDEQYLVLWWVPAGHVPTIEEGEERLLALRSNGASPEAFTLRHTFPMPADDPVRKVAPADRVEADPTPGMTREQAVATEGLWAGFVRTEAGTVTSWHHHGDHESSIYVVEGRLRMESGPGGSEVLEAGPGDFLYVPKGAIHREGNPGSEESHIVVVRAGTGPTTVNVEGPARPS